MKNVIVSVQLLISVLCVASGLKLFTPLTRKLASNHAVSITVVFYHCYQMPVPFIPRTSLTLFLFVFGN